ncbi:MAG TPA: malectin domain-containing carbohydrate-binding protein [Armatimonadota bacterium]|nr:malectin domain-containing carbohydrate-binding protein [Armatimonadota bacterium]
MRPPLLCLLATFAATAWSQELPRYYAHEAVLDANGVIAPWYRRQNGPLDLRVRVAAETLKRYPWTERPRPAPHYVFSGAWGIAPDGTISIPPIDNWSNGDLGQRAAYVLSGLVDYYRYSGDPAAISHIAITADALIDFCQTPADHPWPRFLVSVPTKGMPYGVTDPHGFIQLDIVAEVGIGMVRAYELVGERRWLEAAKHWADLLVQHCDLRPGAPPWPRYANPEDVPWEDHCTGGVVFMLAFFDELERVGYTGRRGELTRAREAGEAYLRDTLLPRWTEDGTWGRNYWDWNDPVQAENVTEFAVRYMMEHPSRFPNWRNDCRNVLSLFLNRTSVARESNGDVFSGAWAYPESSGCCGRSLWYGPFELAPIYAQYSELTGDEWAREMARRQLILATYDVHETGVVEDNIDGGPIVAGAWFKIAHPMALKHALNGMAWLPDLMGAARENHILRASAVVRHVQYGVGDIRYETAETIAPCVDVVRLAFEPAKVTADGVRLAARGDLAANGFTTRRLECGDVILTIRHDGRKRVAILGPDPGQAADDTELTFEGPWRAANRAGDAGGTAHAAAAAGAAAGFRFTGNQVRLLGRVGPMGGRADVYVDGVKQLVGIDTWCPQTRYQQALYYRSGLIPGPHELRIVVTGTANPLSAGRQVVLDAVQWSAATGDQEFGEGGGPTGTQRVVFGYAGREGVVDSNGNTWLPATEWIARLGAGVDIVQAAWWTDRRYFTIAGTNDPELYRYGAHAPDFATYFTVAPGTYHVRVKLAETRRTGAAPFDIELNGEPVVRGLDVAATAGGLFRAVDLVFEGVQPTSGVIALRFRAWTGEAMVQAIEVGPGPGGSGATPMTATVCEPAGANLLANPEFEEGGPMTLGRMGDAGSAAGWRWLFASPTQSYVWVESGFNIHPECGLPHPRTGKDAERTHTDSNGHTVLFQEVAVRPDTAYRASVWVRAVDLHGKGFGSSPGDSAGLIVLELDAGGGVVAEHKKVAVTRACDYFELVREFTTKPNTARIRFVLDTVIGGRYDEGHVTYDDCSLTAVP